MKRKYLLKRDREDLRYKLFSPQFYRAAAHLPSKVDLRSGFGPVFDQGDLGSCSANAFAAQLAYTLMKSGTIFCWEVFSRLFIYYEERLLEGTTDEDCGAMLCDGIRVLETIGACPEDEDVYIIADFTEPPTAHMLRDAANYRIKSGHRVTTPHLLKAALAEGKVVAIGMTVFESTETPEVASSGIVPMPSDGDEPLGGHAVLVVGYDDARGVYIIRNSWGAGWGDQGYFYLPYEYWQFISDAWTISA